MTTIASMMLRIPSTMPAIATPPLVASPRLARCHAEEAEYHRDDAEHHAADNRRYSAMIATTSAAMPSPFFGAAGGGVYPV